MWWISFLLLWADDKANFVKAYGGMGDDFAEYIQQTQDKGFIVTGTTNSAGLGNLDILILKLTLTGQISWAKTYGTSNPERAYYIEQTQDNGYVIAGKMDIGTSRNGVILKTTEAGDIVWSKALIESGETYATCIRETQDNGFIVVAAVGNWPSYYFWVTKLNSAGNVEWGKYYSMRGKNRFVEQTQDGGFIVFGTTESHGAGDYDFGVLKLTATGDVSWAKTYGIIQSDQCWGGQQTQDGGFIVTGWTRLGEGEYDCLILKLTPTGDVSWAKTYGDLWSESAPSIQETKDGGFIFAGQTNSWGVALGAALIIKTNVTGDISWARLFDGPNDEVSYCIEQTQDSEFVVSGTTSSYGAGGYDCLVFKLGKTGNYPLYCDPIKPCSPVVYAQSLTGVAQTINSVDIAGVENTTLTTTDILLQEIDICPPIAVEEQKTVPQNEFAILPNLAYGTIVVKLNNTVEEADIKIYDCGGRKVRQIKTTQKITKIDNLNTGIYFYKINIGKNGFNGKITVIN